jgi:hypothetical protein
MKKQLYIFSLWCFWLNMTVLYAVKGQNITEVLANMNKKLSEQKEYRFLLHLQQNIGNPAIQQAWYFINKDVYVQKDVTYIVWENSDKKIIVSHPLKKIWITKKEMIKGTNNLLLADSLTLFAQKAEYKGIIGDSQHYQTLNPTNTIDFYYKTGDSYFHKLTITSSNGFQQTRLISDFSEVVKEPFLLESYYLQGSVGFWKPSAVFSGYALHILGYDK